MTGITLFALSICAGALEKEGGFKRGDARGIAFAQYVWRSAR
jgi:hypothetical protein